MNENQIRDLLKESIENTLNDFYHERIVPLEKQIIKLGGTVKKNPDEIELKFRFRYFNPIDAFKDTSNHFWDDPESVYYKFFSLLFKAVLDRGWISIDEPFEIKDVHGYWMGVFGCSTVPLTLVGKDEKFELVRLLEWKGTKVLLVYLIDTLMDYKIISSRRRDITIEENFLIGSSVANLRKSTEGNKFQRPKHFQEIHDMIEEIQNSLD
jgi:hypothetical protein